MIDLADEIISLISKKRRIKRNDIQDHLRISRETTDKIVDFLVKFGFAELDGLNIVKPSKALKRFLADNPENN